MEIQTIDAEQSSAYRTPFQGEEQLKDWESLSQVTATAVEAAFASHADLCRKIKVVKPMIAQMRRIFVTLREYRKKDSTLTVAGCATWTEYCEKILHRTDRAIRKLLEGENPDGEKYANKNPKATKEDAKSGLGSATYVNEFHPQHQAMKDKGLINDEAEAMEAEEAHDPERPPEEIVIKRKDGSIIPEAAYAVEDAVRQSMTFIQSTYKCMKTAEKIEVIDGVIAKLRSERNFIHKDTAVAIGERPKEKRSARLDGQRDAIVQGDPSKLTTKTVSTEAVSPKTDTECGQVRSADSPATSITRPLNEKLARKHKKQVQAARRDISPAPFAVGELVRFIPYEYDPLSEHKSVLDWLKQTRTNLLVTEVFEGRQGTGEQILNPDDTPAFWSDCKCDRPGCKHEVPVLDATEDGFSVVEVPQDVQIPQEFSRAQFKYELDWEAQIDWWPLGKEPDPEYDSYYDERDELAAVGPAERAINGE